MFMKPTMIKELPNDVKYVGEIKYDGTRVMLKKKDDVIKLISDKTNRDVAHKYPEIIENFDSDNDFILDCEICCFNNGKSDFNKLLTRNTDDSLRISYLKRVNPVSLMVFDVMGYNGKNLRNLSLSSRRLFLECHLKQNDYIKIVKQYEDIKELWERVKRENLEGIVLKRKDSKYVPKKTKLWLKKKFWKDTIMSFSDWEYHDDKKGITLENDGIRLSVNGLDNAIPIIKQIEKHGKARIEFTYLRKNPSGKYFQLHFKRLVRGG